MAYGHKSNTKAIEWIVDANGCHVGTSHMKDKDGYMKVQRKGKCYHAHRYVYIQEHGEIPDGLVVMHTCDNPACINLEHLKLGTNKDNTQDMIAKGRAKLGLPKGYKFTKKWRRRRKK